MNPYQEVNVGYYFTDFFRKWNKYYYFIDKIKWIYEICDFEIALMNQIGIFPLWVFSEKRDIAKYWLLSSTLFTTRVVGQAIKSSATTPDRAHCKKKYERALLEISRECLMFNSR